MAKVGRKKDFRFRESKDRNVLRTVAITGFLTKSYVMSEGFSEGRADWLFASKYVEEAPRSYIESAEKAGLYKEPVYVLTSDGRERAAALLGITRCYSRQNYKHDARVQEEYLKLTPSERERCVTEDQTVRNHKARWERDLRNEDADVREEAEYSLKLLRHGLISPPDFSYTQTETVVEDGVERTIEVEIGVEVMVGYKDSDKIKKYGFCDRAGMEGRYIH